MTGFVVGPPAREKLFYGRQGELEDLLQQPSTWMCGQRRMGKTSLLYRAEQEALRRGWLPLFFNIATLPEASANGENLFRYFFRSNRLDHFEPRGLTLEQFEGMDPAERFFELVEKLSDDRTEVLFLWDEAERLLHVEKNDPGFLTRVRACLEGCTRFRIVISATQMLSGLFEESREFLSAYRWQPLCGLSDSDAIALLRCEHTGGWASPLDDQIVEEAVRWCGGHPLILQTLGSGLAESTRREGKRVNQQILRSSIARLLANKSMRDIFVDDYLKLTPVQQMLLRKACLAEKGLEFDTATVAALATESNSSSFEVEDAAALLASYGYIHWNGRVSLRFQFYRHLLPEDNKKSFTDPKGADQIRRTVFVSYSHKDAEYLEQLSTQLAPLTRNNNRNIDIWDDRQIEAGSKWKDEIRRALERARVAVLLVSPAFLASKFVTEMELPFLLSQAEAGGCQILCLHLQYSVVQSITFLVNGREHSLADFQGLNSPESPLDSMPEHQQNKILADSALRIVQQLVGSGC